MAAEQEAFQPKTEPLDVGLILDGQEFYENELESVLVSGLAVFWPPVSRITCCAFTANHFAGPQRGLRRQNRGDPQAHCYCQLAR